MIEVTGVYQLNPIGLFFLTHTIEILSIIFGLFIAIFIINLKSIFKFFSKIKLSTWLILLLIFIIGFLLRNIEYRYGAGLDGFFYPEYAKMLFEKNLFVKGCAIGNTQDCRLYHQHLSLPGYPYLISLSYFLFGLNDLFAMQISGFLGSLIIITVFLITYALFFDEAKAILAALIFTFIPIELFIVPTSAVRTTSLFFQSLVILFYLIALKKDSIKIWSLLAITFSYSIYVRHENYVLIAPMILGFFLFNYIKRKDLKNFKSIKVFIVEKLKLFYIPIILFLLTQVYALHWILFGEVGWNADRPIFSYIYFKIMAPIIFKTLFFAEVAYQKLFFIPLFSFFFLLSIVLIFFKKYRNQTLFLLSIFFTYFILTSSFLQNQAFSAGVFSGKLIYTTEFVRYLQAFDVSYAILSSLLISFIIDRIRPNKYVLVAIFLITFLLLFGLSGVKFKFPIFADGRLNEIFTGDIIRAVNKTPNNSLIFISQSTVPNFDLVRNKQRRWIDIDLIPANDYNFTLEELKAANHSIMFIQDYRCKEEKDEQCNFIFNNFNMTFLYSVNEINVYNLTKTK